MRREWRTWPNYTGIFALLPEYRRSLASFDEEVDVSVPMTKGDRDYINNQDRSANTDPLIVGVTKKLSELVGKNRTSALSSEPGAVRGSSQGKESSNSHGGFARGHYKEDKDSFTWSLKIKSEGAIGIRVRLTDFFVPEGTAVYLMNEHSQIDGPYNGEGQQEGSGEVWSKTVYGEDVTLVFTCAMDTDCQKKRGMSSLVLTEVGIFNPNPQANIFDRNLGSSCGGSAGWPKCINDAQCCLDDVADSTSDCSGSFLRDESVKTQDRTFYASPNGIGALKNSAAKLIWASGGYLNACSGGLIENESGKPLLLTANHCISWDSTSFETFFSDVNSECGGLCDSTWYTGASDTVGMTVLGTSSQTDFTLVELAQPLPTNNGKTYTYLGWDSAPVGSGKNMFRMSYPGVGPLAYSEQERRNYRVRRGRASSWCGGKFLYSKATVGETAGGSSGSPVVNVDGKIVGQLYGVCGSNLSDDCDNINNSVMDGAFSETYSSISSYLGSPAGSPSGCSSDADCITGKVCSGGTCVEENGSCVGEGDPCEKKLKNCCPSYSCGGRPSTCR